MDLFLLFCVLESMKLDDVKIYFLTAKFGT